VSVLIDTPIWSLALCRKSAKLGARGRSLVAEWKDLVSSGIRESEAFVRLREHLAAFDDVSAVREDHERGAEFCNACRTRRVTPTANDMTICALAARHDRAILTTDRDFARYATLLPIRLRDVRRAG